MPRIVIACYKPKPGKAERLEELLETHLRILQSIGLATDRQSIVMKATDGTVIEVFEWVSKEAIESAHNHPKVLEMWREYSDACDYVPLRTLDETSDMFAEFTPFNI